ncbi:methyltransferase domain-containing protein [Occultella glacieicola]|uniref:Methyltransferase domain-containing protein n=2 Tax=Occultella glacieicola TaxID=2518684 RepID=A0ABY2E8W4_9MICO|nr:methyltransferase domain-containing protein [Occultella glacieicola]
MSAMSREQVLPAIRTARRTDDPAAVLARLFVLGDEVTVAEAKGALGALGVSGAARLGLLAASGDGPGDQVRARVDLRPVDTSGGGLWLAADLGEATTGAAVGAEHVLGIGGASRTLAELTVRTPVARALDLGTGSGIQALNLAGFAQTVVGTDISRAALDFAAFNAALNGYTIDLRQGSMLDPVEGEQFDLVVSNPPFVITPRTEFEATSALETYTYRDGGRRGDDLVRDLITGVGRILAPGGTSQFLANWEVHRGEGIFDRVQQWLTDSGLDGWVIQREYTDPAEYAETWLRDGGTTPDRDPEAWRRGYTAWLDDFEARGVDAVGFGYVTLHRPERSTGSWHRCEEITGTLAPTLWPAIAATLRAKDRLADLDDHELADQRLHVAGDVTEERHYTPGQADPQVIVLRQGGGLARTVRADTALAAVVGASDGELTVGQIAAGVAVLTDTRPADVLAGVLPDVRGLVLDGLVLLPD